MDINVYFRVALFCNRHNVKSILNLSLTCKTLLKEIWNNNYFWKLKLQREYVTTEENPSLYEHNDITNNFYRKIYTSLYLKIPIWYRTNINETVEPPQILDEVNRGRLCNEEIVDYRLKKKATLNFHVTGEFPAKTKVWLVADEYSVAFLTKREAIAHAMSMFKNRIKYFFSMPRGDFIQIFSKTPEEYFGSGWSDLESVYSKILAEKHIIPYPSLDYPDYPDYTQLVQVTL